MGSVRDQLLAAAVDLLRQAGPDAVTTTAVAKSVGIKQPSVYAHFSSRQALLTAAINEVAQELAEFTRHAQAELRAAGADDPAALHTHFTAIVDNAHHHREVITVWISHRAERTPLGDALRDVDELFVEAITDHVAALVGADDRARSERFARVMLESVASVLRLHLAGHLEKGDAVRLLVNHVFAASSLLLEAPVLVEES